LWFLPKERITFESLVRGTPLKKKEDIMKVMNNDPDMLKDYDFSKGARGKYANLDSHVSFLN
jgi:hypothetical protein